MVVERHEDYWTRDEKRERETGTSVVAGGIFVVIVALIAVIFAIFGLDRTPEQASVQPPAGETTAAPH